MKLNLKKIDVVDWMFMALVFWTGYTLLAVHMTESHIMTLLQMNIYLTLGTALYLIIRKLFN